MLDRPAPAKPRLARWNTYGWRVLSLGRCRPPMAEYSCLFRTPPLRSWMVWFDRDAAKFFWWVGVGVRARGRAAATAGGAGAAASSSMGMQGAERPGLGSPCRRMRMYAKTRGSRRVCPAPRPRFLFFFFLTLSYFTFFGEPGPCSV